MTIKSIPDEVLQKFKAYCNIMGKTMSEELIDYMKQKASQVRIDEEKR